MSIESFDKAIIRRPNLYDKSPLYMFCECGRVKCLWSGLVQCFQNSLMIPTLTPQTAITPQTAMIIGIPDSASSDTILKKQ